MIHLPQIFLPPPLEASTPKSVSKWTNIKSPPPNLFLIRQWLCPDEFDLLTY